MIISRYLCQKCFLDGSVGILSTKTGSCLRLGKECYEMLAAGRAELLPSAVKNELTQAGILVEEGADELEQVLSMRRADAAAFRILTTTQCNASCIYCYEKGLRLMTMDRAVAEETAAFLSERLKESGENTLLLEWFGGEPLLNKEAIDRICGSLWDRRISFRSTLTTNGVLLSPEEVDRFRDDWSLAGVQIGLDGAGRDHEQLKGLPEGSFNQIIETIHRLQEAGCRVRIRIVHTGDMRRESALISFLAEEFQTDKPHIYLFPRYEVRESELLSAMEEILSLEQLLVEAGFLRPEEMYHFHQRRGRCFAADGGLTIAPDGNLFSCSHAMQEKYCVGTVWDFSEENTVYRRFTASDLPQRCLDCTYLPFCMGGCRAAELKMPKQFQCNPYSSVMDRILGIICEMKEPLHI